MSNVLLLVQSSCTEGFMNLSLLEGKAADPHNSILLNTLASKEEDTRWIITSKKFNCNNIRIREVLIGVDIRTNYGNRTKYPCIDIWYKTGQGSHTYYNRNDSVPIILSPDNFTTNGTYRYVLHTPIYASNGYMLGVYQPKDSESVVRFYKANAISKAKIGRIYDDTTYIKKSNINEQMMREVIMIHPITGQCTDKCIIFISDTLIFMQIQVAAALIKFSLRMK